MHGLVGDHFRLQPNTSSFHNYCMDRNQSAVLKMLGSGQPVLSKIMNKIGSDILSPTVAHPSGSGQFDHIGIDEGICRSSLLPTLQSFGIALRSDIACLFDSTTPKEFRSVQAANKTKKFTPKEFKK